MRIKLLTSLIAIGTILLVSGSCNKTTEVDLNAACLGKYRIEFTYEESRLNGEGRDCNTITKLIAPVN